MNQELTKRDETLPTPLRRPWPRIVGVVSRAKEWKQLREGECDLVELRLDAPDEAMRDFSLHTACPLPLLLTFRHASEGGYCKAISEEARVQSVRRLLPLATAIDWEIAHLASARDLLSEAHARGVACIASAHFWGKTPEKTQLDALEKTACAEGMNVLKIAFTPHDEAEVNMGLSWLTETKHALPVALMGMGAFAKESRSIYARHGSCLMYGYLGQHATAPGQLSVAECRCLLNR